MAASSGEKNAATMLDVLHARNEALAEEVARLSADTDELRQAIDSLQEQIAGLTAGAKRQPATAQQMPPRPFEYQGQRYRWKMPRVKVFGRALDVNAIAADPDLLERVMNKYPQLTTTD